MFAEEMWFGGGEGVECGRSTGLCPLPLGVPRCVIHDKKNVGTKFLVILKKNNINHQNHSNNAKKQKNFQRTKHLHRDLSTTDQKNRPFGFRNFTPTPSAKSSAAPYQTPSIPTSCAAPSLSEWRKSSLSATSAATSSA